MRRVIRWLIIVGLVVFIYWYAANSGDGVARSYSERDWREDVGLLALLATGVLPSIAGGFAFLRRRRAFVDPGPTIEISFHAPLTHFAVMGFASALGSIAAFLLFSAPRSSPVMIFFACLSVLMALLAALFLAMRLTSGPARLRLSPTGLDYGPFKCGPIDWQDIRAVRAVPFGSHGIISLEIIDPEKYFARGFPKFGRNWGRWVKAFASPFVISPAWLQAPFDAVLFTINVRLTMFGRAEATKDNP